jgi:hypothetical protein
MESSHYQELPLVPDLFAPANSSSKSIISFICTRNHRSIFREVENLLDGEAGAQGLAFWQ